MPTPLEAHAPEIDDLVPFVSGLNHKMRNLLFALSMIAAATPREGGGQQAELHESLTEIVHGFTQLSQRLNDIVGIPNAQPVPFSINKILKEAETQFNALKMDPITLRVQPLKIDLNYTGYPQRLSLALHELLKNAAAASPPQATIALSATIVESTADLLIQVQDVGSGLPQSDFPKLFTPFFSRKKAHLGLGLLICARVASEHQGTCVLKQGAPGGVLAVLQLRLKQALTTRPL